MKNLNIKFLLFALLCFTTSVFAQESYRLQYSFEKGKDYKYKMTNDGIVTQTVMGQEVKINTNGEIYVNMEAEEINADSTSLLVSLDSAKYHINMPMRDTTLNLENIIGKRTRLTILNDGKVLDRETVDTVKSDADMTGQISSQTTRLFILPDKEIKIGETWNIENVDSISMMGGSIKTKSNTDYTLLGTTDTLGRSCLRVEFKGKTTSEGKAKVMGMDLFIEGNGKLTGIYLFDAGKGLMINANSQVDNELTMAATGEQNMIIPISQSSKVIQTLLEK